LTFLLVSGDFVLTGGMDRANFALADYLSRHDHQVELVAYRVADELLSRSNVELTRVSKLAGSYFVAARWLSHVGFRRSKDVIEQAGRVIVNGGNCPASDVNWVHYLHAEYQPTVQQWTRKLKQQVEYPMELRAERRALQKARLVIANSDRTRQAILQHYQVSPSHVRTIYYGIDAERFYRASNEQRRGLRAHLGWDDRPRMVFIGALSDRRKGFDTLSAAWKRLCQSPTWSAVLVVIGSGSEQNRWKELLSRTSYAESVEFLGFRSDVPDVLRAADGFVAPTRYEAYGLGVHEAICCGLPAIVSSSAGVAERYPENCRDLLIDNPDDVEALVEKLRTWYDNREAISDRIQSFSTSLRSRSWDDMAKEIYQATVEV
jgi:glycosyltransferase involved in cell wall biosynthesis